MFVEDMDKSWSLTSLPHAHPVYWPIFSSEFGPSWCLLTVAVECKQIKQQTKQRTIGAKN